MRSAGPETPVRTAPVARQRAQLVQTAASDIDEIRSDATSCDSAHIEDLATTARDALQNWQKPWNGMSSTFPTTQNRATRDERRGGDVAGVGNDLATGPICAGWIRRRLSRPRRMLLQETRRRQYPPPPPRIDRASRRLIEYRGNIRSRGELLSGFILRSTVDEEGQRWLHVDDLFAWLRLQDNDACHTIAESLEDYTARCDADLRAGRVGRNRLSVVRDD
uniref:hypothetical protein n=1 Tax=Amycolatopsis sp. CA-096443 TaxID=3239919 RepID=UPI003F499A7F